MKAKKILAMALAVGMTLGLTGVPTFADDKKHLYLVIPLLMQRMKKQILIPRIPTPDGHASAMAWEKLCSAIPIPWRLNHGLQKSTKI